MLLITTFDLIFLFPTKRKLFSSSYSIFSYSSLSVPFIPPPAICPPLWDHGNCASSVAFHALPAALQDEACSNDLLLSSLAIIALTINSRLAFLSVGGGSAGSLIRAPCNVSGSSSHPATSALPLLRPCLFYRCLPLCFPPSQNDWLWV